ncbi:MAG: polysaccharide biosynthesis tyrosine autokinase [Elusimicrobiota bacterium]|jgi:capsular exopolysaccharide synthesis family protein
MNQTLDAETEIDLNHYVEIILRRRWIILSSWLVVFISAILITFTTRPVYQASTMLVIEKERNSGGAIYAGGALIENSNEDYYQTQYKLLQSQSLLEKVYSDLNLAAAEDFRDPEGVEKFKKAVSVSPILRSRLVYVRVSSHDAKLAAQVSNTIGETFVNQNLANQLFISKEVLQTLKLDENSAGSRKMYDSLPSVVNNTLIQTLKGEYAKLEAQYADMSQRFTPKYPAMVSLKSNMAALHGQIQAETDKIVQSLKTELSGQFKGNNVRIIDPAKVPNRPIKPKKTLNLILGFLAGLAMGFLITIIVETVDQTIRTQEDVEAKLKLPFLGLVPFCVFKDKAYEPLLSKDASLSGEAIRNLRTMIDFAGVSQKAATFLVTSAVQSEGKSHIASNLAVVFAQIGGRVLLIDGDMRRPTLHKVFHISSQQGLSDFLAVGADVSELKNLAQKTELDNLQVLPCGPRPPNPSELLNTPKVGALMAWAKANYDRVIVDCPPMFPINDTILWGHHIPSVVIVTRYGATRTPLIANAGQKIQASGVRVLGVAINAAKPSGLSYAAYGHYYHQYYHDYQRDSSSPREVKV